jgi:hypothetical protein
MNLSVRKPTGHALVEYVLPIALVGIMGGLFVWNDVFGETFRTWMGPALNASQEDRRLTLHPMGTLVQDNTHVPFETTILTLTLADGTTIAVPGYPKDITMAIETMGNNGATDYLSGLMKTLAESLLEEGTIDHDQFESLMALATQGERMAKQMAIAEEALEKWKIYDVLSIDPSLSPEQNYAIHKARNGMISSIPVQDVDGNAVSLLQLVSSVGFVGPSTYELSPTLAPGEGLANPGAEMAHFLSLYHAAGASEIMGDPAVSLLMSHLVGEIAMMGEFVESLASAQETAQAVSVTRENSNTICTVGGGDLSNGVRCI